MSSIPNLTSKGTIPVHIIDRSQILLENGDVIILAGDVMDDLLSMDWGGFKMASSVPIPPTHSELMQDKMKQSTAPATASKDSGHCSAPQQMSPLGFTQGNSPAYIPSFNTGDGMHLSPFDSPSPQMWQTVGMDMEEHNIKVEPTDFFNEILSTTDDKDIMDTMLNPSISSCGLSIDDVQDYINNSCDMSDVLGETMDPIGLDPQHSSPAAMNLVRPDDIMGFFGSNSSHQASTSYQGMHRLPNTNQHTENKQNVMQSHSFTSLNQFPQHINNNNRLYNQQQQAVQMPQPQSVKLETTSPEPFQAMSPANSMFTSTLFADDYSIPLPESLANLDAMTPLELNRQLQSNQEFNHENDNYQQMQQQQQPQLLLQKEQKVFPCQSVPQNVFVSSRGVNTQLLNTGGGIVNSLGNNYQQLPLTSKTQSLSIQKMLQKRHHFRVNAHKTVPSVPTNTPVSSSLRDMLQSPSFNNSPHSSTTSPLPPHNSINNFNNPVLPEDIFSNIHTPGGSSRQSPVHAVQSVSQSHGVHSVSQSMRQGRVLHNPRYQTANQLLHQKMVSTSSCQASSSAPDSFSLTEQMIWRRREPRKHMQSTGSVAEEEILGLLPSSSVPSPYGIEESVVDSDDEDGNLNENFESDDEIQSLRISDFPKRRTTSNSSTATSSGKKERHFWQYNVQAKGPKGQRVTIDISSDPHQLLTITDPVFNSDCALQGIKHSGKARRGDGNDLDPNPVKLVAIGKQLKALNKMIADMTPMAEQPSHARSKSRKEKNKLASRACRLKKKAQHEANKIRLYGVKKEHQMLLTKVNTMKQLVLKRAQMELGQQTSDSLPLPEMKQKCSQEILSIANYSPYEITSHVTDFINNVIDKCQAGVRTGGLDDLAAVMTPGDMSHRSQSPLDLNFADNDLFGG